MSEFMPADCDARMNADAIWPTSPELLEPEAAAIAPMPNSMETACTRPAISICSRRRATCPPARWPISWAITDLSAPGVGEFENGAVVDEDAAFFGDKSVEASVVDDSDLRRALDAGGTQKRRRIGAQHGLDLGVADDADLLGRRRKGGPEHQAECKKDGERFAEKATHCALLRSMLRESIDNWIIMLHMASLLVAGSQL